MNPKELLDEIREGIDASAWSNAVRCARNGEATLHDQQGTTYWLDVQLGRTLPCRVELNVVDLDWSCTCPSRADACAHVAAGALTLYHAHRDQKGLASTRAASKELRHLRHRLCAQGLGWRLETLIVGSEGDDQVLPPTGPPPELTLSPGDRAVLSLTADRVTGERLPALLRALALCDDVQVEGRRVRVNPEPVPVLLIVEDHALGLLVRIGPSATVHAQLPGSSNLVVVGEPPTLRPLGRSSLSSNEAELYANGRIYRQAKIGHFMTEILPRLKARTRVELRSRIAPRVRTLRPYLYLQLFEKEGCLEVLGTVTYGDPPQAVAVADRIHLLEGATVVPERIERLERRLAQQLQRVLGTAPGRRRFFTPMEAARFVTEVLPHFRGKVKNPELASRWRQYDAELLPRWIAGSEGKPPELTFVLPSSATGTGHPEDGPDTGAEPMESTAPHATAEAVLQAWLEGRSILPLMEGGFARLPADWLDRYGPLLEALLEESSDDPVPHRAPIMAQLLEAAGCEPKILDIKKAVLEGQAIPTCPPASGLKATLRVYQQEGLDWLSHLERQNMGGILADDMGLGKTVQTLALELGLSDRTLPTLVVAPTSVLDNWVQEAARFTPDLKVLRYHGSSRTLEAIDAHQLVVTTYGLVRRDINLLRKQRWFRIVLDEAQAIKNPDSQSARAVRQLDAAHRLALTGTPVENRLLELWSILNFVNPGMLGRRQDFEERYQRVSEGHPRAILGLRLRVQPFILRRLKQDVAKDLPPKTERVIKAVLTPAERKVYNAVRLAGRKEVQQLLDTGSPGKRRFQILEVLLRMRQACCHASLVPGSRWDPNKPSSKLKVLMDELEVIVEEGHKALVFSQWTGLLDRVEPVLRSAGLSWVRLDGKTRNRSAVVDQFQAETGPPIFLISLKAGGLGLNLTAADYVYLLDPWWNPATEDQATDRAYRIGQTRPVVASKIIAADTIEERVLSLQVRKRALSEAALGGDRHWVQDLSEDEIVSLLDV